MDMTIFHQVKFDCRFFDASKPCKPHKTNGYFCDNCAVYAPIEQRVLVIKFGSIGDVVRTTSLLPRLREEYRRAHISWITAPNAADIFLNNSYVDKVYSDPSEYLPVIQTVQFDIVYNLESDLRSSAIAEMTNANIKKGFILADDGAVRPIDEDAAEWFILGINDELKKKNTKTYFEQIFRVCGFVFDNEKPVVALSDDEKKISDEFHRRNNLYAYRKIIGINTGSGGRWQLKKWTFENYRSLMIRLHDECPDVGLVLFGGPEEHEFNAHLMKALPFPVIDAGTNNSLRRFFALLDVVDVLFTPDSLALHSAAALNKSVIVYTGPTSFTELSVFDNGEIIHSDIDCLGCYLNRCDKEINCMNSLTVDQVFSSIVKQLE